MSEQSKHKKIYYKQAQIAGTQLNLSDMLYKALLSTESTRKKVSSREESIGSSGDMRFINFYENYNGMFFSQFISVEAGKVQSYLHIDKESETYPINPINLELLDKKPKKELEKLRREFLDSILYFGVIGNHIAIIQSSSLRARQLESYLNWFLGSSCCNILPDNTPIILTDAINEEMRKRISQSPAKEITVGTPLHSTPKLPNNGSNTTSLVTTNAQVASVKHTLDPDDASLIKRFFGLNLSGKEFSDY